MDAAPLVSIIIPTRHRTNLLSYAIESALAQTYHNIEVIVHDNNPKEDVGRILSERFHDARLRYYNSDRDFTMCENWNAAFSYVRGKYFVRLDDDNVFYPDFVESAIREIKNNKLHAITYYPLIVQLQKELQLLFAEDDTTYTLTPAQLVTLEYFVLTDSNYSVYQTDTIRAIFQEHPVYQTTLPDRYMNYKIAEAMNDLRITVGVNTSVKGLCRFDYRPKIAVTGYEFGFKKYDDVTPATIASEMDCQNNFTMHRVCTLWSFVDQIKNDQLAAYIQQHLLDKHMYVPLMEIGHIRTARFAYSVRELNVLLQYVPRIISQLITRKNYTAEGKRGIAMVIQLTSEILIRILLSIGLIALRKQRTSELVDPSYGENLLQLILQGKLPSTTSARNLHGAMRQTLATIVRA